MLFIKNARTFPKTPQHFPHYRELRQLSEYNSSWQRNQQHLSTNLGPEPKKNNNNLSKSKKKLAWYIRAVDNPSVPVREVTTNHNGREKNWFSVDAKLATASR